MKRVKAENIERTKNWRVLLYGTPGIGKTSAIKNLPGKTIVLTLDGSHKVLANEPNITVDILEREKPSSEMNEYIKNFEKNIDGFDNFVLDNITTFQSDWFVEQGRSSKNGITNELQQYNMWTNYFLRLLTAIYSKDINIYVTAWEETRDLHLETGQIITQYVPIIRPQVLNQLLGLTDVVGRVQMNKKTGNRGVILEGSDGVYAKNRLDNRTACKIEDIFNFGDVSNDDEA